MSPQPVAEPPTPVDLSRRFGGLDRLYGVQGAKRIARAHVVVVGIGGVGSWTAEALARSGVGHITLVDMDHVSESNINRQIHALDTTIGQSKVLAMRERVALINPSCAVTCIDDFVDTENWPGLLESVPMDGVIDACDNMRGKTAMAAWARTSDTLFVACGAAGGKRLAHQVTMDDLAFATHDPLLAQLRYQLRKHHAAPREPLKRMGVTCVFSREAVIRPNTPRDAQSDGSLNCSGYGSTVAVTATFGICAAGWMLNALASAKTQL